MGTWIFIIVLIIVLYLIYTYYSAKADLEKKELAEIDGTGKKRIRKSDKTWGGFYVTGFHHLSKEDQNYIWKELKVGMN